MPQGLEAGHTFFQNRREHQAFNIPTVQVQPHGQIQVVGNGGFVESAALFEGSTPNKFTIAPQLTHATQAGPLSLEVAVEGHFCLLTSNPKVVAIGMNIKGFRLHDRLAQLHRANARSGKNWNHLPQ